jgi:TPR repeat protein
MYGVGRGVSQDAVEAVKWFHMAAAQEGHEGEMWRCFATSDYDRSATLFTLTREKIGSEEFGEVAVAGVTHPAQFRVAGLQRRWDFGYYERRDAHPYAFVIKPDGTGLYYDFSTSSDGTATASGVFKCLMSP